MKILITGGTGFVGRHLVKALLRSGDKVFVLVRPSGKISAKDRVDSIFPGHELNLLTVEGDITKKKLGIASESLQRLKKEKIDFVWHLAANLSFNHTLKNDQKFKVNVLGTANVVDLANSVGTRLCHVSTAYICGNAKAFSEKDLDVGQKFRNDYERTKFLAEKVVRERCKISYIIFRPSIVIGEPTEAKTSNCTFSYFRYAFLFFFFKRWLVSSLKTGKMSRLFLKALGAKLDGRDDGVTVPLLTLPYPKDININMVPIEYIVKSFLKIASNKSAFKKTYHLTHPNPRPFIFYMMQMFNDLGIKQNKFVGVSPLMFKLICYVIYLIAIPWRDYIKSALLYLPYVTSSPNFIRKNVNRYNRPPKKITRDFLSKIHKGALAKIFPTALGEVES